MEPTKNAEEIKKSIPVICNSGRLDEGNVKRPHGIHLNPKFFKSTNEGPSSHGNFRSNQGPLNLQPRFNHDVSRMQYGDCYPRPYHFESFPQQRYPPPGPRQPSFRQQFHPDHGPGLSTSFPQFNGPPPHLNYWHEGPIMPPFHHNHGGPPPVPSFPNVHGGPPMSHFPHNYAEYNATNHHVHPPESHSPFNHAFPSDFQRNDFEPFAGPSRYERMPDFNEERGRRRESRSRSRSGSWRHRSLSGSSASYSHESQRGRKSRSLSSSRSFKSSTHDGSPSVEKSSESETIWDSDNEPNSDSDLDLSKPLDSLASNVGNSTSLLKDAIKCLGASKVHTMIPLELSQIGPRELFRMCKKLLDDTENDELIKVLEGSVSATKKDEQCSQDSLHSQKHKSKDSESDNSSSSLDKRKVTKKKKSKRKRKKKKKSKVCEYKSESDEEESPESIDEDINSGESSATSGSKPETLPSSTDVPKQGGSHGVSKTQQSLLELIQIEYKTKAINVMLKNLGVATEISSLVSNALNTNGVSVVQNLQTNQEAIDTAEEKDSCVDNVSTSSEQHQSTTTTPSDDDDRVKPTVVINEINIAKKFKECNASSEVFSGDNEGNQHAEETENDKNAASNDSFHQQSTTVDEVDLLKRVDEDVLDLEVGANEEIDFPDI